MPFRFPVKHKGARLEPSPRLEIHKETLEEKALSLIQGRVPGSKEEWMAAKALDALKLEYIYQYPLFGGSTRRGGYIVDFMVRQAPDWVPVEIQSERWHLGQFGRGEILRAAIIEKELGEPLRYVWEDRLQNVADAIVAMRAAVFGPPPSSRTKA